MHKIDFFKPKICVQIGLFTNIVLTFFKLLAGILGASKAMVADGFHSLSDVMATGIVYAGISIGARPPDEAHPYGHGSAETIAASLVSLVVIVIGVIVGLFAILVLIHKQFTSPLAIALIAAIISIGVKEGLFRYTISVGRKSNSPALIADAWHHRSDAYTSIAALIGIVGARISFLYMDPLAGLVVSGFIIKVGFGLIRSNIDIIMDKKPKKTFINNIKSAIQGVEGVKKIDSIKVRRLGPAFNVELKISVDGMITVNEGHRIASSVKSKLLERFLYIHDVVVHINPFILLP